MPKMESAVGPEVLREALEQFRDVNASLGEASLRDADRARLAGLITKWAPYLGEAVKVGEKTYNMHKIPTRLWPMMAQMFENQVIFNPQPKSMLEDTTKS